ncbi:DNA/RNA nuclease SfsA [Marinomonas agarivorans]|nr:DNA/RNA nuclease SfsA [Marinomonas agarivorans]
MEFPTRLIEGRLVKRYKRFLADVRLADDSVITVHCPNTGSMKRCQQEAARVWISDSHNDKRKYRHTWELVEVDEEYLACINTGYPNKLVGEAVKNQSIYELKDYKEQKAEVKYGENSRIDWLLTDENKPNCYIEVKNVTLLEEDGIGYFPDAVTDRGRKHLYELAKMVEVGYRGVLLFCVSHTGINQVSPASHIDEKYAVALKEVAEKGVEVIAYKVEISTSAMTIKEKIPVIF